MAENGLQDDFLECPLCMEPLGLDDINFYPCACRYQICRFCWHRIRTDENGLCPHCREPYSENPAEYTPPTQEQMAKLKSDKKQKTVEKRQKVIESRKNLASVRVVQKNLVFVIGLSPRLADPEILKKNEYFGKFGRIYKVVINNHTVYNGAQGPSVSAYVTYVRNEDASKAITAVNNAYIDGRYLKASFGTTKYCTSFLKGIQCTKPDCMYLHELGDNDASFTKEDMQLGKHQTYENATLAASNIPPSFKEPQQPPQQQQQQSVGGVKIKHVAHKPTVNDSAESALPATASWGSSVKSAQPAANHTSDSAQQSTSKETKTNSHVAVSHSHSTGIGKHKHQQLVKSHSHTPSHGTSGSLSRASKVVKDSISHHSRSRSGPLSPAHSNEPSTKKQSSSKPQGHGRSGSTGKSTPSLSPKSTLSGSSSSGSIKHDVDSEMVGGGEDKQSEERDSGTNSLNTSREEEEEGGEVEEDGRERDDQAESIKKEVQEKEEEEGGWCQISEPTDTITEESPALVQGETRGEEEGEGAVDVPVVTEGGREEREEKESLTATVDNEASSEGPIPAVPSLAPPTSSDDQQDEEDSSIVKVIPSFGSGGSQFGALGVSWNTALPQQLSSSIDTAPPPPPPTQQPDELATPTSSTHTEDDLGFDPWDVSQQGLADLMKSEQQEQEQRYSFPHQPALATPTTTSGSSGPLTNGLGNGSSRTKSSCLQEEFKALFPNVNVSFEGRSMGNSSESSLPSGLPLSTKSVPTSTSASSYIPSRLDSALSSTYHPLLGTSPLTPITSCSSSAPGGSLQTFLGQHQPGFPSSSIKVHTRSTGGTSTQQSMGSKLGSSEWPDLGVSITSSKPSVTQWTASTEITDTATKSATVTNGTATSTLPPPPPGFTAKTTPTATPSIPGTAIRAPGTALNNTVNHSLWAGGGANVKGAVTGTHLLQSWANFMKFSSLTPAQQQQLARGSQIFQQLLLQQQYLIRQSLLVQSNPYYQAHAQALAQAQATLRAQLQQNILRQQQIAAAMAAAGQKIVSSTTTASATGNGSTTSTTSGVSQSSSTQPALAAVKTLSASEGVKNLNHGVSDAASHSTAHTRPHPQPTPSSAQQSSARTQSTSRVSKNSSSNVQSNAASSDRKAVRLKAK